MGLAVNAHDAVSDDGTTVVCNCGKTFEGAKAREQHAAHFRVAELRRVLAEAEEKARQ